jgi:hypothetical protein
LSALAITIDYETLSIKEKSALIPSRAEIVAVEINGTAHRDSITFSQCHVFEANSKISDLTATLATAVEGI